MIYFYVFGGLTVFLAACFYLAYAADKAAGFPRYFPKGHIRDYDPSGRYTYKDQNPTFKENR